MKSETDSDHSNTNDATDEQRGRGQSRVFADKPSWVTWWTPPRARATNFNPYHDQRGRFTTTPDQPVHLDYTAPATTSVPTISMYPTSNHSNPVCVPAGLQTLIGTALGLDPAHVPELSDLQAKIEAAVKERNAIITERVKTLPLKQRDQFYMSADWTHGGLRGAPDDYGAVIQKVLAQYGVKSTYRGGDNPATMINMEELTNLLIAKGTPAMVSIGPDTAH